MSFYSSNDTEMGWVGVGTGSNDDTYLQASTGDLRLMANGIINMDARLEITGSNSSSNLVNASGDPSIKIRNTASSDNSYAAIDFYNNANQLTAKIGAQFVDTSDKDTDLFFMIRADG